MMLQVVASPMIIILMTPEALMTVILTTIKKIYIVQVLLTINTYDRNNIVIVQATDLTMKFLQT